MAKIALLIGVDEYEPGFNPLPAAGKDIEALRRVLQDPEMGDFHELKSLKNPDPQIMQYEIEAIFSERTKEDLILLYFSGHGIKDDAGNLYFATRATKKNLKGELVRSTAVPASFIHEVMKRSRAKRQVIILDCCFSEAFDPILFAKNDNSIDLRHQLGSEGRVVLASSSSTEYSFEQEGAEVSVYTRYLIEGIETGAADTDNDGNIYVHELHDYAKAKVQEVKPNITPKILLDKEGFNILIAKAPIKERNVINLITEDGSRLTTEDGLGLITEDSSIDTAQIPTINPNINQTENVLKLYQIGKVMGAGNDVVADNDYLGFHHYVKAFSDLIESPYTKPPLTIGIFGSWGMGKSFLLDHITRELQKRQEKRCKTQEPQTNPPIPFVHIVKFNAWEYSAAKHIWPGLVRKIMNQLEKELYWGFPGLFGKKFLLNLKREFEENKSKIILFFAILSGFLVLNLFKFKLNFQLIWGALLALGVTGVFKLVADTLSKPLSQWIEAVLKGTDYGKQINYMEEIHSDLELLARRLKNNNGRVLIIIDDLDRCEPQKAVEVLQAVNLLLNFKSFIVCLGIDARIITRAVEKHYSHVLGAAGASGYEYLDKIVQIPFRIPEPNPDEIKLFISEQLGNPQKPSASNNALPNTSVQTEQIPTITTPDTATSNDSQFDINTTQPQALKTEDEIVKNPIVKPDEQPSLEAFSYDELEAFQHFVRYLRPNPRHLKRLINVYRLVRTLAEYRGEEFILNNPFATIRWLVVCGQWPYTTYAMLYYFGEMLERIEESKMQSLPEDVDPLEYLHKEVIAQFHKNSSALLKQRKLDHDPDLLRMLLQREEGRLTWDELDKLRQYTVNFNPAVEATLKAEVPVSLPID
ncbi:caspase family protein [Nostoc spongiaeforme FACHB-130]|uniref:Caspase family protein n=1 Tax=Nostoc spongiaeforme FACHB-130 TaxID=1357510 RepID=A0ABR8FV36_9NOSO|nr:P-loop NTPase fold protein [Nostoc spongiaeforme]MBD2595276.1 caspase family protein [Nostoc spongiaeforme FACHB-130]